MKLYGKSWAALKDNIHYMPIPALADLVTLAAIMVMGQFYKAATIERYASLFTSAIQAAAAGSEFSYILISTLVLYTAVYFVFTLLQSVSWFWAFKFCDKKIRFMEILKHYALYNMLWVVLIVAVTVAHKILLVGNVFAGGTAENLIMAIAGGFYAIVAYFALVSYLFYPLGAGVKKGNIIIPVLFLIWVTYLVLDYFAYLANMAHQIAGLVVSIIILLPLITWARGYLILAQKEVLK